MLHRQYQFFAFDLCIVEINATTMELGLEKARKIYRDFAFIAII